MNESSLIKLSSCHEDIKRLAHAVDEEYPIQCIEGHRSNEDQKIAFDSGHSLARPGMSGHNKLPSIAADFVPDPDKNPRTIDWKNREEFQKMLRVFEAKAKELGIKIRLGRDFRHLSDLPHVELICSND